MTKLVIGVMLWSFTHFLPALKVRRSMLEKLGENPYKGIFTLLMVAAIYLIISGWKSAPAEILYLPPEWGRHAAALLVLAAFALFGAPYRANNFKRVLRHPQLSAVALWGVGHLLANGELRSVILFGGLALWAVLEMILLNRRDGEWVKPDPAPLSNDLILVAVGAVLYVAFAYAHPWLFGVSPIF